MSEMAKGRDELNGSETESESRIYDIDFVYERFDIEDFVDRPIWQQLNEHTKKNIVLIALSALRPDGIDEDLWTELSDADKFQILNCSKNLTNDKTSEQHPDEVVMSTWTAFTPRTKLEVIQKLHCLRPPGFDSDLWDSLRDSTKQHIGHDLTRHENRPSHEKKDDHQKSSCSIFVPWKIYEWITRDPPTGDVSYRRKFCRWWIQRATFNSRILAFFSTNPLIENPDSGIGALVLVCALILTIPFGCISFLNDAFFTGLQNALALCPDGRSYSNQTYAMIHFRIMRTLSACIFFSMMGLILSSVYYVFKPRPGRDLDLWCRNQGRFLIGSMFLVTALDIIGLIAFGTYLLEYSAVTISTVCTYNVDSMYLPGVYGVVTSFVVGLLCML